ncbi:MAG TPA: tyrosine-protein phosphatase [Bryobacteraceae bacterium]|nr:tyrosine-protein phosphatase [Bryobacteraceae bacterium]
MFQAPFFSNFPGRRAIRALPAFLFAVAAFAQSPAGVPNFHVVNDHVYRGAQPSAEGFQSLAKLGVKTVIDLRADETALAEKAQVEGAGMHFINIPMHGMQAPSDTAIKQALALFESSGPVFVHCKRGADRTGTVVACYRITHDHWDNHKALDEARSFGMSWVQRSMHHYVLHYRPPAEAASTPASPAAAATAVN